jgi:hypothetical protein
MSQLATCHVWLSSFGARRGHALSELDSGCGSFSCILFFSSSWRPSLVVPLYPFSMSHEDHPYKTSYAFQDAHDSDFGGGLLYSTFLRRARRVLTGSSTNSVGSSPILSLRLHLSVRLPHKSSECRVILYHWARSSYCTRPSVRFCFGSFGLGCTAMSTMQTRDPKCVATRFQC